MSQRFSVTINPNTYVAELEAIIASNVAGLRNALRALEDGSFVSRASMPRPDAILHFVIQPPADQAADAVATACNRCFLDLVRALINYIDRMVAIQRCTKEPITLQVGIQSGDGLLRFMREHLESAYQKVARDTQLSNPKKLEEFHGLADFPKKAALSYFTLRRCLEHHGAVPLEDFSLHVMTHTILAGDQEITHMPFQAEAGTQIKLRTEPHSIVLARGQRVALSEADIEKVFFTIQFFVAPEIRRALGSQPAGRVASDDDGTTVS